MMIHRTLSLFITLALLAPTARLGMVFQGSPNTPDTDPCASAQMTQIPRSECLALQALHSNTNGDSWTNKTDWLITDTPCSWYGVSCTSGHVSNLTLGSNNLSGALPEDIGDLTYLKWIDLDDNQISGGIPAEIGSLTHLETLSLTENQLSGSLPEELGSLASLKQIYLTGNQLTGSVPAALGSLASLEELLLNKNQLNGSIPAELGGLANLKQLNLSDNQFSGSLPPELGSLGNLEYFYLGDNSFSGEIPLEFGNLAHLKHLIIRSTQIGGEIPPEIGNLTGLEILNLTADKFNGEIPTEIGSLVKLTQLNLNGNQLSGEIPLSFTNLISLTNPVVDLGYNALTAADPAVQAFVTAKDPDWADTQTIAPSGLHASQVTTDSLTLAWTPITYTGDGGYYSVEQAALPGGSFGLVGDTLTKTASAYTLSGLVPGETTYLRLRTYTPAHEFVMTGPGWLLNQQNELWSAYTPIFQITSAAIDPALGGSLVYTSTDQSTATVLIPPDTLTQTTTLAISSAITPTASGGFSFAGQAFEISAYQEGIPLESFNFADPVTVTLQYSEAQIAGLSEASLTLDYWNGSAWVDSACGPYDRHPDENWLAVPICHLSDFALFGRPLQYLYLPFIQ